MKYSSTKFKLHIMQNTHQRNTFDKNKDHPKENRASFTKEAFIPISRVEALHTKKGQSPEMTGPSIINYISKSRVPFSVNSKGPGVTSASGLFVPKKSESK